MLLAEFTNPDTGECYPSQQTMADILDTSRVTVNRAIQKILRIRGGGLLTSRPETPEGGGWAYNVYRLNGIDSNFQVTREKGQESAIETLSQQFAERGEWLAYALALLEEHGIGHDVPADIVEDVYTDTKERDSTSEYVSDLYITRGYDRRATTHSDRGTKVSLRVSCECGRT